METQHTHHKIKAEWTRQNEALEESHNQLSKNTKTENQAKNGKIEILEQIVFRPNSVGSVCEDKSNETSEEVMKEKKSSTKKTEECRSKKCQICEKSFPVSSFDEHVKSHGLFECSEPDCHKKFKRKSSLRKHMYIHKGKFKYECEFEDCKLTFIDKVKYQIHVVSKHKKVEQIYECKECDKTFTSADYLRRHQITHKDEFPYPCTMCSQKFKWFTSLQTHNMIHTQNKTMVQCTICLKRFFTQRTLDRHLKIHQNIKYHCKVCKSIVSIRKDNIMRHIRHLHSEIPRSEINSHISSVEEQKQSVTDSNEQKSNDIEVIDDDYDDESNDLIIDESANESEVADLPPVINNRVNVIQSIGNPNKNQQQTPQAFIENNYHKDINSPSASTEQLIDSNKTEGTNDSRSNNTYNNNNNNSISNDNHTEAPDHQEIIKLPPKKKAIAKYNPIEHYRKILGLSETNTSSVSNVSNEASPEQVFPDHWRKRTSQNFLFRR